MKSTPVIIAFVSMVTVWCPVATNEDLSPDNPDSLNPDAAHVCQEVEQVPYTVKVSFQQTYIHRTTTWCVAIPPRCTEVLTLSRVAYKTETRYRNRKRYFCCDNYKAVLNLNYCVPKCKGDCFANMTQGICVTPDNCRCYPGFKGEACESGCADNEWGQHCTRTCECGSNGACDPSNGNCICHIGYTGNDCSQKCVESFGLHCVHPCACENGATCNHINGRCTCAPGFHGAYCQKICDGTSTGEQGCEDICPCQNYGICDEETGACICPPGTKGEFCAVLCDEYYWGVNCQNVCDCFHGRCDRANGFCHCKPGYFGKRCQHECPVGYYGEGCLTLCPCQNGGKCYYPDQNSQMIRCNCTGTGFHGDRCSERDCAEQTFLVPGTVGICQDCSCAWDKTDSCHPLNGSCSCKPGYTGSQCTENCRMPFYGRKCSELCKCANGDCDHVTGNCTTCYPGYLGLDCDVPCEEGFWGLNCQNECQCQNDAECHVKSGYCICKHGYAGQYCETRCPKGKYGQDCAQDCDCDRDRSTCSPLDGQCLCNPGYTGMNCEEECTPGRYGYFCSQYCDCSEEGTLSCDPFTGYCQCKGGWTGTKCDIICADNNWGPNCVNTCDCNGNGLCNRETGACICFDGYQGENCDTDNNGISVVGQQTGGGDTGSTGMDTTALIVAVTIPCVILLIIIALVVTYFLRKVRMLKDENLRVRYEANGIIPGETTIPNGNAGIGVINPTYAEDNARNERRYPHLSQRASAVPPPLPHRQQSCDPCDDIDVEKLRVSLDDRRSRPVSSQYADIDDVEDRYTTLKSVSGAANTLGKETGSFQFYTGNGNVRGEDRLSRSSSRSSEASGGITNKGYVDMEGSANHSSSNPSPSAFSQPLYDNKEPSANGLSLDQPDALSSTASDDSDHAPPRDLVHQSSKDYDFPKSTSLRPNETSDSDVRLSQAYINSTMHLPPGQTDTNKRENPYDTPSNSLPTGSEKTNGPTPPHNGYITPKNDVNSTATDSSV